MSTIDRLAPEQCVDVDRDHRYLSLDEAGDVLESLSSRTAQSILVELRDDRATATEIADRVGTSIQNVSYHLSRLEAAGLLAVAGSRYSEKGREMTLYTTAVVSLVIGHDVDAADVDTADTVDTVAADTADATDDR